MTRKMIVNAMDVDEVRIAILNNGILEEFDIEARGSEKIKGNIYKAVVVAVEPALNAAFVNYGADKQGFLTAGDVDPRLLGNDHANDDRHYRIEELLKPKQSILVQVSKDEVANKGAVLTTYLSLAGRYVVLMPEHSRQGVSRKIEDEETRKRMREAASMLETPDGMGVIIRTAGKDRTKADLSRDHKVLLRLWDNIQKEAATAKAPALIFKEQDVIIRALRDYFSSDIDEIILDSDEAYDRASEYMHMVMPNQTSVLTRYVERRPIFHHYRVEEQMEELYTPKVSLPSGGSIVIQPTEAMVSIDVNSGRQKSSHHEETAFQTNYEAAREIARQLRLRDLGGIIVIDFIDMLSRKNQQRVERVLNDALKVDKARVKIGRISRNGTLELTRQRIRTALQASMFETCTVCRGTGHILSTMSHAVNVMRRLRDRASRGDLLSARVRVEPKTANHLRTEKWADVEALQQRHAIRVDIVSDPTLHPGEDDFTFETNPDAQALPMEEPNFGPAPRLQDYDPAAFDDDVFGDDDDEDRDDEDDLDDSIDHDDDDDRDAEDEDEDMTRDDMTDEERAQTGGREHGGGGRARHDGRRGARGGRGERSERGERGGDSRGRGGHDRDRGAHARGRHDGDQGERSEHGDRHSERRIFQADDVLRAGDSSHGNTAALALPTFELIDVRKSVPRERDGAHAGERGQERGGARGPRGERGGARGGERGSERGRAPGHRDRDHDRSRERDRDRGHDQDRAHADSRGAHGQAQGRGAPHQGGRTELVGGERGGAEGQNRNRRRRHGGRGGMGSDRNAAMGGGGDRDQQRSQHHDRRGGHGHGHGPSSNHQRGGMSAGSRAANAQSGSGQQTGAAGATQRPGKVRSMLAKIFGFGSKS